MRGCKLPNEIPIKLITAGNIPLSSEIWRECHQEMVKNSENHKLLIAEGNNHDIPEENPKLVIDTIIELIRSITAE